MTHLTAGASGFAWGSLPLPADDVRPPGRREPAALTDYALGTPQDGSEHCYPGQRPDGSFVVFRGHVLPVIPSATESGWQVVPDRDDEPVDLDAWLGVQRQATLADRLACVGYGSNLNPQQVAGFGGKDAVVVLRGVTVGLAAAYCSSRRASDGQFPAGVVAAGRMRVEVHGVVLVDPAQLAKLDHKEGQGTRYTRSLVSRNDVPLALVLENGTHLSGALPLYLQDGRHLALQGGHVVLLADAHQAAFQAGATGAQTREHGLAAESLDLLPRPAWHPLPVFAYGSLRPGHRFWPRIEGLIDHHEPASIQGHRFTTGVGFPGLLLKDGAATTVEGTLLHLRADAMDEAMRRMDLIEGHPELYARHLLRIDDGRLAWAYLWAGNE